MPYHLSSPKILEKLLTAINLYMKNIPADPLVMTFEANTIKHLAVKMYSNMPPALAELIANAYDACAEKVHVRLYDKDEKKVVVEDDGIGMSFNDVNNYFLRIGRNRREEHQESPCNRVPTGKKG